MDRWDKKAVFAYTDAQGVPESAFGVVSVGRHFSAWSDSTKYRMPDVLIRLGAREIYSLDATIGTKTASTPQVRDTLRMGASS